MVMCSVCGQSVSRFICGNCARFLSRQDCCTPEITVDELEERLRRKLAPRSKNLGPLRTEVGVARARTMRLREDAIAVRKRLVEAQLRLSVLFPSTSSSSNRWPSLNLPAVISMKKEEKDETLAEKTKRLVYTAHTHHSRPFPAIEPYREQATDVVDKLRAERKRVCSLLVSHFPLKKITRASTEKKSRVITLGVVTALELSRGTIVSVEEQRDIHAALGFLVQLVSHLALYLDVTLPFPCGVCPKPPRVPTVYRPLRKHWYYFTVQDGNCTKSFAKALKFLREDLRRLCETQGISVPLNSAFPYNTTVPLLKLLDACLHARHFGTMCPPFKAAKKFTATAIKEESPRQDEQSVDEFSLLSKNSFEEDAWIVIS